ncbi:ABC transporter substrate-binding protein [Streptomyces sp. NPDC090106]|uniref:ABC transporter substrate-binding protein n=1 Tax=Streptomyces sp. NPDC090106 TaxID=3365946 RepID=UPI003818E5CD
MTTSFRRSAALLTASALASGLLAGCASPSGSSDSDGSSLSFLIGNDASEMAMAKSEVAAFEAANPDITIDIQTRPAGTEGDNAVKTKLSTGDMADVFTYNTGSLLQSLKPAQTMTPIEDTSIGSALADNFVTAATSDGKLYGVPFGLASGGGILYNTKVYKRLGLEIPKTWSEFMANNAKIKKEGLAPVVQTYGETWTSQVMVLGDYHNVEAADPDFATSYTDGKVKYATNKAALAGFQHIEDLNKAGYLNSDYRSATLNDGLKMLAEGKGVQFPMVGASAAALSTVAPDQAGDVGIFPIPGTDAASFGLTMWAPSGLFIPKTVKGAKLEAARKFQAFVASKKGCEALTKDVAPTGPYMVNACTLPDDASQVAKDTQSYILSDKASLALEFSSPVKGPNLEQICIQVGTGIESAKEGAEDYDKDVRKQADQLGLNWTS